MRATIKSIARDLGISHMTVSRALSGSERVQADTRRRVMDHAVKVGYVKSSAAITMRGDPTAIVGLLLPNIINEFYARFANSLGTLCADAGFDLVIHLTNDDYRQETACLTRLHALQARMVVRVPAPRPKKEAMAQPAGTPVIDLIRHRPEDDCVGTLMIDDGPSIQAAVKHLIDRGYRRVAYIGAAEILSSGQQRLKAFTDALGNRHDPPDASLVRTGAPSYAMGRHSMDDLLETASPPDALVCGGFEISNGALDACLARGIHLPDQLAFIGYGDPSFYRWIAGGITTIVLSEHDVASRAIEMMTRDADRPLAEPAQVVSTSLVMRRSA